MTHKKKCFAKIFFVLAVAIVVAPICASLILEFGFKVSSSGACINSVSSFLQDVKAKLIIATKNIDCFIFIMAKI